MLFKPHTIVALVGASLLRPSDSPPFPAVNCGEMERRN
jgi:hypothetical protein